MVQRDERVATRIDDMGGPLSEEEIVQLVRLEIEHSMGHDSHVLGDLRARALDFYHGNTESSSIPQAPEGRSNIVSMDVHDTVNALLAEILPMIKTSLVSFPPKNRNDEQQARLESDFICNELEQNGWDEIAYSAMHSALLQGLGWVKVEPELEETVDRQTIPYAVTDPVEYDAIGGGRPDVQVNITDEETEVVRTIQRWKLRVDCVAPENVIFSPARNQFETDELRFIAERKLFTVNELVYEYGMTPDQASEIPDHNDDYWPGMIARREKYYSESDAHQGGWQEQEKLKECFCCYMDIAMDRGGPTEKWYLMVGGRHLIQSYPVPFQPWVNGSPIPMPHRIQGRGMYETMKDIQQGKTDLLRSLLDNASVANMGRTAYNENTVNVNHLLNGRMNGAVAVNGSPVNDLMALPNTNAVGEITAAMQYMDDVRASRGGASVDMNDSMEQLQRVSAEAAYGVKVSKEKMAGFYARNLVSALLKGLYVKAHQTMRLMPGVRDAKIRGEWVQTDPQQWPERAYVTVQCGMTDTERRQKIQSLSFLNAQLDALNQTGAGGILTDVTKKYNALADWVKASNIGMPEDYLLDPTSPDSQQAQQQKAQQGQMMERFTLQLMQHQKTIEEMQLELDKYKHDTELKYKYWETGVENSENTQDNATKIEVAQIGKQASENRGSEDG